MDFSRICAITFGDVAGAFVVGMALGAAMFWLVSIATPYSLRHTGAVWAAEEGRSMAELAQFLGHDDSRTTEKHYARYSPDYLRGVANAVGSKLRGSN